MELHKYLAFVISAQLVISCGSAGEKACDRPIVAVSIEPQRQILESLAGDDFEVVTVLKRGANPETFETTMSQQALLSEADAYFSLGVFPFEDSMKGMLKGGVDQTDCSDKIKMIYGTHDHDCDGHHHDNDADPHYWTSISNAKIIARTMVDGIVQLNPSRKEVYFERLDSLNAMLDSIDAEMRCQLADAQRAFAIWHPSLTYFANDYGLHQISVGYESKEISPRQLHAMVNEAKADSVTVLFYQKEFDSRQIKTVNDLLNTRQIVIDPLSYDWLSQLKLVADELAK